MLTIRLSRIGKRKKPMYRLIISEKAKDTYGDVLEILGSYNPFSKELVAKKERIQYWISKGSGMSNTVNNLLVQNSIIEGEKVKASKPGKKSAEEIAAEKKKADDEAAAKKAKEAAPVEVTKEETPAEEVKEAVVAEETK